RNLIVSGLSRGVLVVEADERSGALITARQACDDHGRTVFAVPGRVDQSTSAGPHRLIREGAVLTTGLDDIVQNLDPLPHAAVEPMLFADPAADESPPPAPAAEPQTIDATRAINLTDRQRLILSQLDSETLHV